MIALYGGGNVSTCGFSSGGALPDFEAACKRVNVPSIRRLPAPK